MKINFNAKLSQKEKELLKTPFKKLVPEESRAWFFPVLQKMHKKLKSRGLMVYPNVWYSNEWFCPEGYNGIAIPFYLAHPKIPPLARKLGKYLEGTTLKSFERLIFHELGHAVEHAYGLSQQRWRVKTFGSTENPYPKKYRFDPKSKDFVRNLDSGYAQSHPDEDFAETFRLYLRNRKSLERFKSRKGVYKKLLAVSKAVNRKAKALGLD